MAKEHRSSQRELISPDDGIARECKRRQDDEERQPRHVCSKSLETVDGERRVSRQ